MGAHLSCPYSKVVIPVSNVDRALEINIPNYARFKEKSKKTTTDRIMRHPAEAGSTLATVRNRCKEIVGVQDAAAESQMAAVEEKPRKEFAD
jgi:hypothetical protein